MGECPLLEFKRTAWRLISHWSGDPVEKYVMSCSSLSKSLNRDLTYFHFWNTNTFLGMFGLMKQNKPVKNHIIRSSSCKSFSYEILCYINELKGLFSKTGKKWPVIHHCMAGWGHICDINLLKKMQSFLHMFYVHSAEDVTCFAGTTGSPLIHPAGSLSIFDSTWHHQHRAWLEPQEVYHVYINITWIFKNFTGLLSSRTISIIKILKWSETNGLETNSVQPLGHISLRSSKTQTFSFRAFWSGLPHTSLYDCSSCFSAKLPTENIIRWSRSPHGCRGGPLSSRWQLSWSDSLNELQKWQPAVKHIHSSPKRVTCMRLSNLIAVEQ